MDDDVTFQVDYDRDTLNGKMSCWHRFGKTDMGYEIGLFEQWYRRTLHKEGVIMEDVPWVMQRAHWAESQKSLRYPLELPPTMRELLLRSLFDSPQRVLFYSVTGRFLQSTRFGPYILEFAKNNTFLINAYLINRSNLGDPRECIIPAEYYDERGLWKSSEHEYMARELVHG